MKKKEVICLTAVITYLDESQTWHHFKSGTALKNWLKRQNLWCHKSCSIFVDSQDEEKCQGRAPTTGP